MANTFFRDLPAKDAQAAVSVRNPDVGPIRHAMVMSRI